MGYGSVLNDQYTIKNLNMAFVKAHVVIEGRVQGVFYRASTCEEAKLLNLKGWVQNCHDGRVEAVFEGEKNIVNKMIDWCQEGPPGALVNNVKVDWEKPEGKYLDFSIRY